MCSNGFFFGEIIKTSINSYNDLVEQSGLIANKPFKVPVPGRKLMVIVEICGYLENVQGIQLSFKVIYLLSKYTTLKQGKWQFFIA